MLSLAPILVRVVVTPVTAERLAQQELLVEGVRRELGLVHLESTRIENRIYGNTTKCDV